MFIYLCSRYSRRDELRQVRERLQNAGHTITSEWLDTDWVIDAEKEFAASHAPAEFREEYAVKDLDNVLACEILIAFTEPSGNGGLRGGRHVEFGAALAWGKKIVVVGQRENIFYFHPRVQFFQTTEEMLASISDV
jgi:hypothetical protein